MQKKSRSNVLYMIEAELLYIFVNKCKTSTVTLDNENRCKKKVPLRSVLWNAKGWARGYETWGLDPAAVSGVTHLHAPCPMHMTM